MSFSAYKKPRERGFFLQLGGQLLRTLLQGTNAIFHRWMR